MLAPATDRLKVELSIVLGCVSVGAYWSSGQLLQIVDHVDSLKEQVALVFLLVIVKWARFRGISSIFQSIFTYLRC